MITASRVEIHDRPPLPVLVCFDTPVGVVKYLRLEALDPQVVYAVSRTEIERI